VSGSGAAALVAAASGEGLGMTVLRNSILWSAITIPNCRVTATPFSVGTFTSEGYNLIGDGSCGFAGLGDQIAVDPLLAPLAANGGATPTRMPMAGSPAIDTGTPLDCPATDQRGFGRPTDGDGNGLAACDKGAVEAGTALPPPATGTIRGRAFDDVDGDGNGIGNAGLAAIVVCVFPTAPSLCTTTLPDGTYEFTGLTPGIYSVYQRVPATRYATTPRSRQVAVTAGGVAAGVDFGSQVPPPIPPGWVAPGIDVKPLVGTSFSVRATAPCAATSVTATVSYLGSTVSQAMVNVGGNDWQTSFPMPGGRGVMPVTIVADCSPEPFHGFILFVDPSGTIVDGCTGEPLAGATVRLLKNDPYGGASYVLPDPQEHLPAVNPQTTAANGVYAWDVVPGRWRIEASKPGYGTVVSEPFDVPPPRLGLDITLPPTAGCNAAPVAADDAYALDQATVLTVNAPGVLANDVDTGSEALAAVLVANAEHGTVTLRPDGSFTYTPDPGFSGTDRFTYEANDGRADSSPATVTLTVRAVGQSPVARDDAYRGRRNRPLVVFAPGVLANDPRGAGARLRATLVRRAVHGLVLLNHDGSFVYVPRPGFTGADTFTYRARDGIRSSNTATVAITVERQHGGPGHHDDHDDCDRGGDRR
jgi:VCBS repeat-containing protein